MSEPFKLSPPPKPWIKKRYDTAPAKPQKALFAGADCLPGQKDLWNPDGQAETPTRLVLSYGSVPVASREIEAGGSEPSKAEHV